MIDSDITFVRVRDLFGKCLEVVAQTWKIRRRQIRKHRFRERRDLILGNSSIVEDFTSERVSNRNAHDSVSLIDRWNRCKLYGLFDTAEAFEIAEEKCLVLFQWPADGAAILVLNEDRLLILQRLEKADRVQRRIPKVFPNRSVKVVRSTSDADIHNRPACPAIFCAVAAGLDFELLRGIGRKLDDLVRETLIGGAVKIIVDAINQEVVLRTPHAVHVE